MVKCVKKSTQNIIFFGKIHIVRREILLFGSKSGLNARERAYDTYQRIPWFKRKLLVGVLPSRLVENMVKFAFFVSRSRISI